MLENNITNQRNISWSSALTNAIATVLLISARAAKIAMIVSGLVTRFDVFLSCKINEGNREESYSNLF